MRAVLFALLLPAGASAADLTLEQLGAMHPGRSCMTGLADLERAGLERAEWFEPDVGQRGGGWEVQWIGDVALVAGPWTYNTLSGEHIYGTLNALLSEAQDEYDFLSLFVTEHLEFGAFYSPLQNDTRGLGQPLHDDSSEFGFAELEGYLFMNSIFDYSGGIHDRLYFGQELGHRWGSFVRRRGGGRDMLGRDDSHWNFYLQSYNSTMEGNSWEEVEDGLFQARPLDPVGYSPLDLYLMGFLPEDEVPDWFLIEDPDVVRNPTGWPTDGAAPPYYSVVEYGVDPEELEDLPLRVRGDRVDISIEDVIEVEGEREPSSEDAQREFRMAFVIMMPGNAPLSFDEYLEVEGIRETLAALWEEMVGGRATLRTDLGEGSSWTLPPRDLPQAIQWEPPAEEEDPE